METGQVRLAGPNAIKLVDLVKRQDPGHVPTLNLSMEANSVKGVRLSSHLVMSFIVQVSNPYTVQSC